MFLSSRLRGAFAWLVSAVIALTGAVTTAATPAFADVRVGHALFGMHDLTGLSSSRVHEGSVRLWDVHVQWREVELTPGHYTWTQLDQLVSQARAAHQEITMVVAMTPTFYAPHSDPRFPPTNVSRYKDFVSALMHRYQGRIANYEVWNEANITTFWKGTMKQLAVLSKTMHDVRNRVDPKAKVIAPAMVTRLSYQQDWLKKFYAFRLNGVAVWRFYDALAFSLYPLPKYGSRAGVPEDAIALLHQVQRKLHRDGVPRTKPIWNTEVNYGLQAGSKGGQPAVPISDARQAANVARTYLLNAANGVKRVFWYRYDFSSLLGGGNLANTLLSQPSDPTVLTPAGLAYVRTQQWMHGRLLAPRGKKPCPRDSHGTYTCVVKDGTGIRRIYWNPFGKATVRVASNARHTTLITGATGTVRGGGKLTVDFRPVMVRH